MDKKTSIRNWIGKTILWLLGLVILTSEFYPHILEKFYLTDKVAPDWGLTDWILSFFGLVFVIGGIYLNNLLDLIFRKLGKDA